METLAELPLTGDQVGLFKAQPGRPKVRRLEKKPILEPDDGNNEPGKLGLWPLGLALSLTDLTCLLIETRKGRHPLS